MLRAVRLLLLAQLLAVVGLVGCEQGSTGSGGQKPAPSPAPVRPPAPSPAPPHKPCPPNRPWPPRTAGGRSAHYPQSEKKAHVRSDMLTPDGQPMQLEFPASRHKKNTGGSDGAGLCVFCSMSHSGDWSSEPVFFSIFDWMKAHPGGGYPEKVDRMVRLCASEKRMPIPRYLQIEGPEIHLLRLATENGFMPGVTYCKSPTGRYGGSRIAHMVTLVHMDASWAGIVDNNYPGSVEWMPIPDFVSTYTGGGGGWSVILLHDGPPPAPYSDG